ncbi:hypothetical protein [Ruminococcus flavefaciens]|uniref:hypothetical protein n=1 Tax=Ruminococcus flavefaciens TaxID=1265 RepID=UPI0026E9AF1E|nr:hypothetical protein [Ruminococcus flavefaciens]
MPVHSVWSCPQAEFRTGFGIRALCVNQHLLVEAVLVHSRSCIEVVQPVIPACRQLSQGIGCELFVFFILGLLDLHFFSSSMYILALYSVNVKVLQVIF